MQSKAALVRLNAFTNEQSLLGSRKRKVLVGNSHTNNSARFSSNAASPWRSVAVLEDGIVEEFRRNAFDVQRPALMPLGYFKELPAITKWFQCPIHQDQSTKLNQSYLEKFNNILVPLELSSAFGIQSLGTATSFSRSEAPLGMFLAWAKTADLQTRQRLYLAQASILKLPSQMRDDLPTPEVVSRAGKGDVYDTSIWLGVAPTYTPLHKDPNPNLFVQLAGQKTVRILPPEAGQEIFSAVQTALGESASATFRGDEMMQGEEKLLLEDQIWGDHRADESSRFLGQEASLRSGDGVFIPRGWWHSVKGVGTGITGSVSELPHMCTVIEC